MRVLVTWGSKRGGTEGIARIVGEALQHEGLDVDVLPARAAAKATNFDAAIVRGALYANRWHPAARRFVNRQEKRLCAVPVWFFSGGPLDDSAEHSAIAPTRQGESAHGARGRARARDIRRPAHARCAWIPRERHGEETLGRLAPPGERSRLGHRDRPRSTEGAPRSCADSVGDCAGIPNPTGKGFCPPTAQFAIREAKACAKNILGAIDGKPQVKFAFKALGILASLGKRSAVAEVFGIRLSGVFAWFMWRSIYLSKLPGFARRLRVALDWTLDLFFPRDITQLQVFQQRRLSVHHYEPGETIVRKGQGGREFYMILSGDVAVVGEGGAQIARLRPRDVFGEKALLEDTPRTATVRAKGTVDVLVMSRADFRSMVSSFPILEDYFAKLLRERHPEAMARAPLKETVRDESTVAPS